jgi:hypothetical protein
VKELDLNNEAAEEPTDGYDVCYTNVAATVPIDQQTSSTEIFRTESFEEATSRSAGRPLRETGALSENADQHVALSDTVPQVASSEPPPAFFPFGSGAEYAQVLWWVKNGTSDRAINEWFNDDRIRNVFADHFVCRNAKDVKQRLQWKRAQSASKQPRWITTTFTVDDQELVVRHRDALEMVSLLLGHAPFQADMAFSPVRQYSTTGLRIYDELNTAEWWWEAQQKLPEGATIVPIILASDKTQLTGHGGGKKVWPLYISIGNIKLRVRRAVNRPALLLLAYLPVHLPGDRTNQLAVIHRIIASILDRRLNLHPFRL